jgi:hypothetical protein
MKNRLTLLLTLSLLIESCALAYIAGFTRIVWRRDGPDWVYYPHSGEVFIWRDKGNEVFLVASDQSGFGSESFSHVEENGGDRYITTQFHSGHLNVTNIFKNGATGIDFIDDAGHGIPNEKLVRVDGKLRKYLLGDISWREAEPNQSTDPMPASVTPVAGQPPRQP